MSDRDPVTMAVARLAHRLADKHFPRGDAAELRRLAPERQAPMGAAFWRLLLDCVPDDRRAGVKAERRWAAIIHGMAVMAPNHHRQGDKPGGVLFDARYSELRLHRLLQAEDDALLDAVGRLARFLRAKGRPIDWVRLARLILADSPHYLEIQRREIARDYFTAEFKAGRTRPAEGNAA